MEWYPERVNVGRHCCLVQVFLLSAVWLNKALGAFPEAINVELHEIAEGDHSNL